MAKRVLGANSGLSSSLPRSLHRLFQPADNHVCRLATVSLFGANSRSCGLFFSIPSRSLGLERLEQTSGGVGYFIDRGFERNLIRLRRLVEAANLPHKLK